MKEMHSSNYLSTLGYGMMNVSVGWGAVVTSHGHSPLLQVCDCQSLAKHILSLSSVSTHLELMVHTNRLQIQFINI